MDVEQEFRRILQNNGFGKIGKSHRSKCFKDFSDRYQEAMERALSCSRNVARERSPEEVGGGPRERGPGEDSTSEDGGRYGAVLLASESLWRGPARRGSLWCA